ncbi:PREDICTED: 39S ribosomal protein L33, mitochondrial isoform X1 [Vollenhovia emeryi]|uniref:39S ribosomal protein L33, mitochondrial isoform X1 n=1 Tax=Vollenhovia emeryi TaxID=411798 RepID=UPI0005F4628E|nr:PREDICTED: 39S ribosomal protein L33, mitochondrial isoform X1 [Vollenhovia emeryi]
MFLTNMLLKKAKSKHLIVLTQSAVTGHRLVRIRERLADKLEFIHFDPLGIICWFYHEFISLGVKSV